MSVNAPFGCTECVGPLIYLLRSDLDADILHHHFPNIGAEAIHTLKTEKFKDSSDTSLIGNRAQILAFKHSACNSVRNVIVIRQRIAEAMRYTGQLINYNNTLKRRVQSLKVIIFFGHCSVKQRFLDLREYSKRSLGQHICHNIIHAASAEVSFDTVAQCVERRRMVEPLGTA